MVVLLGVVAAIVNQWQKIDAGGIPGVAEGVRSVITAPQPSFLGELKVRPYEWVEAGDPLATLLPVEDPKLRLDLLQSELQIARMQMEPSSADQNALDFERLRVESLRLKQELAMAAVNLQRAESVLGRNELLRKDKLVSEDTYDLSLGERDLYRAEIAQKEQSLAQIESRLAALRPLGEPDSPGTNQNMNALLAPLAGRVSDAESSTGSITLLAPISGMVHLINRQPGEFVAEGEPVLSINASKSDRIVGYLRQPYPIEPEVGIPVEVITRERKRKKFISQISRVGAQVEVITNVLAFLRPGVLVDAGLPIVISVPADVNIRPGEAVDLLFHSPSLRSAPATEGVRTKL